MRSIKWQAKITQFYAVRVFLSIILNAKAFNQVAEMSRFSLISFVVDDANISLISI